MSCLSLETEVLFSLSVSIRTDIRLRIRANAGEKFQGKPSPWPKSSCAEDKLLSIACFAAGKQKLAPSPEPTSSFAVIEAKLTGVPNMNENGNTDSKEEDLQKIAEMVKKIDFCMLTTISEDGSLHSRPMSLNRKVDFDGDLWFFTYGESHKVLEAQQNPQVSAAFSDISKQTYVSISGKAQLVRDKNKIKELWEPELRAWFKDGVETADIALLKVSAEKAEYWNSPSSIVAHTIALLQVISGKTASVGDNKKIDLKVG